MTGVSLDVLGPMRLRVGDQPVTLSKPRHREIIGILLTARGRQVPTTVLVEELWDDPPAGAVGAVRTFIGELRRLLEPQRPARAPATVLVSAEPGYALRLAPSRVDAWRAEGALAALPGPAAGWSVPADPVAAATIARARDEWRGEPYAEFAERPWAQRERARLAEVRSRLVEAQAEQLLAAGRAADAAVALAPQIEADPWRESGWRLYALALYRDARQPEALAVLARARGMLRERFGIDPVSRLAALEQAILRHDPALRMPDDGGELLLRTAAAQSDAGPRSQVEGVAALLGPLATSGSVAAAGQRRAEAIAATARLGDAPLLARVIGGFEVPASWTRSDDAGRAAEVVRAAERSLADPAADVSRRSRARLLATIAIESRGTAERMAEAREAEAIARDLGDAQLLCFALNARWMQSFARAGLAAERRDIGAAMTAAAERADLPSFEIAGRMIRMQALCALDDLAAAEIDAQRIDALAAREGRPLARVFTGWFRWTFRQGPPPPATDEMPGFTRGLPAMAALAAAVRDGPRSLPDGDVGPYEPWARPLLAARTASAPAVRALLDETPDPPRDLMHEAAWMLVARAALDVGHHPGMLRALAALRPAEPERAAGSGAVDAGPIAPVVAELASAVGGSVYGV